MGQAKARGSQAERIAQAKAVIEMHKPKSMTCTHCKAEITEIHVLDVRRMAGIKAGYVGTCGCGNSTFALQGDPQSVANAMLAMEESMEDGATFGKLPGTGR